ncbi:PREDICTED: uncharacterized protein LOC109470926 [Branchiostoma belcheri]|uniref:Uncharacterized protein LOC109470926 n=1 Tax=Branchiostoma belcheri TaxID=7741 RepID=A0A6P4YMF3_BRABE|nr:PREDICTED: uncharacterized protein LOC109470926 [Branchiostoma belcheri]
MSSSSAGKTKGLSSILVLLMVSQIQASEGRHMNLTDWSSSHDNEGKMPSSPPTDNTTYLLNNITSQLNGTSTVAVNSSGQQKDVSPDDNVGLDVTVQPTLTDGTNVTDQALSERSHEAAPDLTDPCEKDNHCTGRCGSWEDTHTCQCDASCQAFGDCCDDYEEVCKHQESAALTNETTRDRAINADSCQWRCDDEVRPHGALCFCNASCLDMGNCCEDYQDTCVRKDPTTETVRQLREEEPLQCMTIEPPNQYNLSESYWMVASCPTSFPRNEARLLCEEKHSFEEDPLLHLPVLSTTSSGHKSYKNVFCAVCNNASSMIAWTAVVKCRGLVPELKKAVKNDECFLEFEAPEGRTRKCFPATPLSSTCEYAEKCRKGIPSPIVVVRKPYRSFRNIFCAKCTLEDLVYREVFCGAEIQGMSVFFTSLSATIDYSEISKTVVTGKFMFRSRKETFACPQGHLYDPFVETCRKVDHFPSNRLPADMRKKEGGNRESQRLPSSYAMVAIFLFFMATRKCGRHLPRNLLETNLILALAINQTGHFLVKSVPDLAASKVVAVGSLHLMLVCELCTSAVIRHLDALARNGANTSRSAAGEVGYILACWFCPGALVLLNLGDGIRYTVVGGCCWLYQTSPPVWGVFAMMPAIKLYHFLRLIITCARHMCRSVIPLLVEASCLFAVSALVSSLMVVASLLPTPLTLSALSAVFATSAGMAAVVVVACRLVDSSISALASDTAYPYASTELPDTNGDRNTNIVLLSVRHLDDVNG